MNKTEQITALKTALDLEESIVDVQTKLRKLRKERFASKPDAPQKPEKKTAKAPVHPKPKSDLKLIDHLKTVPIWLWIVLLWTGIGVFIMLIVKIKEFKQMKSDDTERIKNSDEYKEKCNALDREAAEAQAKYDEEYLCAINEYNKALDEYENITIPKYNNDLAEWETKHNEEIADVEKQLNEVRSALASHYDETRIIPIQYRKIDIIKYLYDMISTSDYDIKEAIDKYDQKVQRDLEAERLYEQQISNQLAREQASEQSFQIYEQPARSSSILKTTVGTATGVMVGNKASGNRKKSSNTNSKKDFMGTSGCMYGKKDESGWTVHCDIRCPLYRKCARGSKL